MNRYRWWHRWWDRLRGRKSINLQPEGYKAVCLACLEPIDPKRTNPEDIYTLSLGHDAETAFAFGEVTLCEEHKELKDWLQALLHRAALLYQDLYGAKK